MDLQTSASITAAYKPNDEVQIGNDASLAAAKQPRSDDTNFKATATAATTATATAAATVASSAAAPD